MNNRNNEVLRKINAMETPIFTSWVDFDRSDFVEELSGLLNAWNTEDLLLLVKYDFEVIEAMVEKVAEASGTLDRGQTFPHFWKRLPARLQNNSQVNKLFTQLETRPTANNKHPEGLWTHTTGAGIE